MRPVHAPVAPRLHVYLTAHFCEGYNFGCPWQVPRSTSSEEELPDPSEYIHCGSHHWACGHPLPENQEAARAWGAKCRMWGIGWMVVGMAALGAVIALRFTEKISFEIFGVLACVILPALSCGWFQIKAGGQAISYANGKMSYNRAKIVAIRRGRGGGGGP